MAHEIEVFADGSAAFYAAREDTWHQLGTVTREAQRVEEALRIAYLDYRVEKWPLLALQPEGSAITDGPLSERVESHVATVRRHPKTGRADLLGIVGAEYQVIQNEEHAEFLNALVDESNGVIETAGGLYNGRRVFVSIKIPKTIKVGGFDPVDVNLVGSNSHDGSTKFRVTTTLIRVVCANTERAAFGQARDTFEVRHTSGATGRIAEAREVLGLAFAYVEEFEAEAQRLFDTPFSTDDFNEIVRELYPPAEDESKRATTIRLRKYADLQALYTSGATVDNIRGTAWGAFNALTEWLEWRRPVHGGDEGRLTRNAVDDTLVAERSRILAALS